MLLSSIVLALSIWAGKVVNAIPHDYTPTSLSSIEHRSSDAVTDALISYDSLSFKVRGERLMIYAGEFHPFRLPVPGLWLDIFQKVKALGYNTVSFYTFWGLLEGNQGIINEDGVFSLKPFFEAASEAGIYLIARPGPYINGEVSAGGFPGWLLRLNATLRSYNQSYFDATQLYVSTIGKQIANAQITKGGPVILFQVENEYISWPGETATQFPEYPQREYMAYVEQQFRDVGITVPFIHNDPRRGGYWAAGTGLGSVDIYSINAYPLLFSCANPATWPTNNFQPDWNILHQTTSPSTPFSISEFQGGAISSWSNIPLSDCVAKVNQEANRVLYKNNYASGTKLMSVYMLWGGTNWGNLGYSGGDSSYDYASAIAEDRSILREKYAENKLQGNFLKVSPAYTTTTPSNETIGGTFVDTTDITITQLASTNTTNFYVVRHTDFSATNTTTYHLSLPASIGTLSIPLLGGHLSLIGRDSKIHVTDYDIGGLNLIYSTADIFTWAGPDANGRRVLILYGGAGETHEFGLPISTTKNISLHSPTLKSAATLNGQATVVQWNVTQQAQTVVFGNLTVYLLWRNDAYNYWTAEIEAPKPVFNYSLPSKSSVIVKAGYLIRSASLSSSNTVLNLVGDVNTTTQVSLIYEPSGRVTTMSFNNLQLQAVSVNGTLVATVPFVAPSVPTIDFSSQQWKAIDSLPEIQASYDDSLWTLCDHPTSNNPIVKLTTPVSLFASDYGYHSGSVLYRGHFVGNGQETSLYLETSGGVAFGHSVWLNDTFLGSWIGSASNENYNQTLSLSGKNITAGKAYVVTILIDHMGLDEGGPGTDIVKTPRGILAYSMSGHAQSDITWRMTGNIGGELYRDKARGPRNEGGMFAERHGYHLPSPPTKNWNIGNPVTHGLAAPGVMFYTTTFDLHISEGYDVPMAFSFTNPPNGTSGANFRVQIFVQGWQFGKYVSNLQRPNSIYPVPEGILNYQGTNTVAITLWALDGVGAQLGSLILAPQSSAWSGYSKPALSPHHAWRLRKGVY